MSEAYFHRKLMRAAGCGACAAILTLAAGNALAQSSAQPSAQTSWFASTPQSNGQSPSDPRFDEVALRLEASLSDEMLANFNLFIYVDKAETGPLAQRMYVFRKTNDGDLALLYDWSVSTGRERFERDVHGHEQSSFTPKGYFEIDPKRLYADHASAQWDEAMPYAMFFNWKPNGHQTGLAIHGTAEDGESALGTRASAGCVRLSLDNAHTLFDLVRSQLQGPTPKLAYLDGESDVSSEGLFLHDSTGRLQLADGYPVLVLVDDYGGENRVTALY
jgi:L,D-transpeptidase catalytic domain